MKKGLLGLLPLLVAAGITCGASPAIGAEGRPSSSWERYREIADRNIFSRNRRPRSRRSTPEEESDRRRDRRAEFGDTRARPAVPDDPGRHLVLIGVSKIGTRYFAFFENTRESTIATATTGDTIGNRKLTSATLDQVEYEAEGKRTTVAMGRTLTGEKEDEVVAIGDASSSTGSPEPPSETESGSPSAPTTGSEEGKAATESTASGDLQAILERLRKRREAEGAQ